MGMKWIKRVIIVGRHSLARPRHQEISFWKTDLSEKTEILTFKFFIEKVGVKEFAVNGCFFVFICLTTGYCG